MRAQLSWQRCDAGKKIIGNEVMGNGELYREREREAERDGEIERERESSFRFISSSNPPLLSVTSNLFKCRVNVTMKMCFSRSLRLATLVSLDVPRVFNDVSLPELRVIYVNSCPSQWDCVTLFLFLKKFKFSPLILHISCNLMLSTNNSRRLRSIL